VTETPPRKRRRSQTPSPSSSHHVNKRFCPQTLTSPSLRAAPFDSIIHNEDAILESDVPESPTTPRKEATTLSVSFAPATPMTEINNPFARLKVSSVQKKTFTTPVVSKSNPEGSKSERKSVRKTPGSVKSNKALPFRIKVLLSRTLLSIVFPHVIDRSPFDCDSNSFLLPSIFPDLLAWIDAKDILDASSGDY
jgi:hypothetical protein